MGRYDQALAIHGFARIEWDHASIPGAVWEKLTPLPNECWVTPTVAEARVVGQVMVERILHRNGADAWAITPTCGNVMCVNPDHLCVTFKTPLSKKEK